MIKLLNPDDMKLVMELDGDLLRSEIAEKFDVPEITIWNYIDEYKELGIKAFSIKALVEWKRDEMKGKDAHQCGNVIRALGVSVNDIYMRRIMKELEVDYKHICVNPYMSHTHNGIKGIRAISESTGISQSTLVNRVTVQGMSIEDAVKSDTGNYKYKWRGIIGIKKIAENLNLSPSALWRKARSMGTEAAVKQMLSEKEKTER